MARMTQHRRRKQRRKESGCPDRSRQTSCSSRPIRIVIADSHEVVRAGIRALLANEHDLEVVAQADNADVLLTEWHRTKPDVTLLTYGLPGSTDVETCTRLFDSIPLIRIIVLVRDNDAAVFRRAVEEGAQGILLGNTSREELIKSVRAVARGDSYLDPEAVEKTFRLLRQQQQDGHLPARLPVLSPQERRIIPLIAEGYTNKEIAVKLALSDKTVKNYVANMFAKLAINRRTQAVTLYLKTQQYHMSMGQRSFA
jgi:two-component system, NarL family, response regulator DevR